MHITPDGPTIPGSRRKARNERDPDATHERILAAAREVIAERGEEGLSLREVVKRAGVNRSTAYQHFRTREGLLDATVEWVSDHLCQSFFTERDDIGAGATELRTAEGVTDHFARFAMEHPELGRVWLFHILAAEVPGRDRFFALYLARLEEFQASEYAQPGIDTQVHAVVMLAATFLWPVWARSRACNEAQRDQMALRFKREILRLNLRGIFKPIPE